MDIVQAMDIYGLTFDEWMLGMGVTTNEFKNRYQSQGDSCTDMQAENARGQKSDAGAVAGPLDTTDKNPRINSLRAEKI